MYFKFYLRSSIIVCTMLCVLRRRLVYINYLRIKEVNKRHSESRRGGASMSSWSLAKLEPCPVYLLQGPRMKRIRRMVGWWVIKRWRKNESCLSTPACVCRQEVFLLSGGWFHCPRYPHLHRQYHLLLLFRVAYNTLCSCGIFVWQYAFVYVLVI